MTRSTRITYHKDLWPAAAEAQGWDVKDQDKRRDVCLACMEAVRGPLVTTSHAVFGADEITALFTYLRHLGDPHNINLLMRWEQCCADYKAFNRSRQADHYERIAFGQRGSRSLQKRRFGNRPTAQGSPLDDPLSASEADQRLWKMRQRARQRAAKAPPAYQDLPPELVPY